MTVQTPDLAIIGGTGLTELTGLEIVRREVAHTPYGGPSAPISFGRLAGAEVLFLPRHGSGLSIPPHLINYQANIHALAQIGVSKVVAVNAVGAIDPQLAVPSLVCPDQLIDYTYGRAHTYEGRQRHSVRNVDFTEPYCPFLRQSLLQAAAAAGLNMRDGATYAATQGPRLETAAEVRRIAGDGGDIVGMTGMPEAALAREAGLSYASCSVIVNAAAGIGQRALCEELAEQIGPAMVLVQRLLAHLIPLLGKQ
jgi:5'-deoxy-5'-methylthioadenosine phosphorylase